jgi:hypothetical protein
MSEYFLDAQLRALSPAVLRHAEPPCITIRDYHDDSVHVFTEGSIVTYADSTFLAARSGRLASPGSMIAKQHNHWICLAHQGQHAEIDEVFIRHLFKIKFMAKLHQLQDKQDAEEALMLVETKSQIDTFISNLDLGAI